MNRKANSVLAIAICLATGCLAGCHDPAKSSSGPKKTATREVDKVQLALDIFRQSGSPGGAQSAGSDVPPYRDALDLLNDSLARQENREKFAMSNYQRAFLETSGKLSKQAVDELATLVFLPTDAGHVESSALFRDAAKPLQIPGMAPAQQAAFAYDWLCRHVLLYEERATGLSAASILRAGFGGPSDRGVAYLALARQLGLEGCLLVRPDDAEAPLVGVLVEKKLLLFDTRLGIPIAGPDSTKNGAKNPGGIATFEDVLKSPDLLAVSKISPDDVKKLEARLAVPMESLAPRMKYLDSLLQGELDHVGGDRLWAFQDAAAIAKDLKAAGVASVGLWAPALRHTRELQAEELIPWPPVLQKYQELKILGELPPPALKMLVEDITGTLFGKYYVQPGEMLTRHQKELPRRLDRIRTAIDESELGGREDAAALTALAGAWRTRVNEAYLGALRNDPEGIAAVKKLWNEDQYLLYLLQPELEQTPTRGLTKRDLSKLVLYATREPLAARSNWLFAQMTQDNAERLGELLVIQKEKGNEPKNAAVNLDSAWRNARSAWSKYLDRNNLGPSHFIASLPEIRTLAERRDAHRLLTLWEYLQRELHLYAAAKMELARALSQTGQDSAVILDDLSKELTQLLANESLAKTRASIGSSGLFNHPDAERRWSRLMRDWGPDGNLAWILESVKLARNRQDQ